MDTYCVQITCAFLVGINTKIQVFYKPEQCSILYINNIIHYLS